VAQEEIEMLLVIIGAIVVGAVALAALYDKIARRHGANVGIHTSGPALAKPTISRMLAMDGSGRRRLVGDEARAPGSEASRGPVGGNARP
jgi:hypothetical protein